MLSVTTFHTKYGTVYEKEQKEFSMLVKKFMF